MTQVATFERLDRPMELAEPFVDQIIHGEGYWLPYITDEEQQLADGLTGVLSADGCLGAEYYVGANRGLFLPDSRVIALCMIDSNLFSAKMTRARVLKLTEQVHRLEFRGLCFEFGDAEVIGGDDEGMLSDVIKPADRLVLSALSLRHTIPV